MVVFYAKIMKAFDSVPHQKLIAKLAKLDLIFFSESKSRRDESISYLSRRSH